MKYCSSPSDSFHSGCSIFHNWTNSQRFAGHDSICFSFSEFLEVGKKQPALDVLYDVIKSKKHRTWQKIHEPIMLKYLELCVDLRKSHLAKEGLYQYKNICQQVCTPITNYIFYFSSKLYVLKSEWNENSPYQFSNCMLKISLWTIRLCTSFIFKKCFDLDLPVKTTDYSLVTHTWLLQSFSLLKPLSASTLKMQMVFIPFSIICYTCMYFTIWNKRSVATSISSWL